MPPAITRPSPSEASLYNLNDTGRLAVVIDILLAIAGGGGGYGAFTPKALTNYAVTVGGTSVVAASGALGGGWIQNPIDAAESLFVDMVGNPASTRAAADGTSTAELIAGQIFNIPSVAAGVNVKVNAATNGHKFNGEVW